MALEGRLNHWADSPQSLIALIVLLDQFPRCIYRRTSKMFTGDFLCQQIILRSMQVNVHFLIACQVTNLFLRRVYILIHIYCQNADSPHLDLFSNPTESLTSTQDTDVMSKISPEYQALPIIALSHQVCEESNVIF